VVVSQAKAITFDNYDAHVSMQSASSLSVQPNNAFQEPPNPTTNADFVDGAIVDSTARVFEQPSLANEVSIGSGGVEVRWYSNISMISDPSPSIVICHELYDALPTHQFQMTKKV
jgi:hypothetical protein